MKHIDFYLDIIQKKTASGTGGGGGITPVGTKIIKSNGKHDVTSFATADVQVPIPEAPTGKKVISVTKNGVSTHDVTNFAQAEVNVAVPMPAEPAGEKVIDIVANGTHTEDIKKFATAKINVQVPNEGITPSGVKTITENGTHDVTQFAQAKVNVPVGITPVGTKEISVIQNGEVTEDVTNFKNVHIVTDVPSAGGGVSQEKYDTLLSLFTGVGDVNINDDTITALTNNAFSQRQNLKSVILNNVTQCGYSTFDACSNLISVQMNRLKTIGNNTFVRCSKLEEVVLPELTRIAGGMFDRCTALRKVKCDKATSIDMNVFAQNSNLEVIDLLGGGTLSTFAYSTIPKLKAFVIRETSKLTQLSNAGYTGFNAGTKVYVPDALVEQYKTASNWSTHADKIVPLSTYVEV